MKQENRGLVLKELRLRKGWSLKTATAAVQRSKGWLSDVENGKARVSDEQFTYLFTAYGGRELSKQEVGGILLRRERPRVVDDRDFVYKSLRLKCELSLRAASQGVGISKAYLSMIETGSRLPSRTVHQAMLMFYGLTPISYVDYFKNRDQSFVVQQLRVNRIVSRMTVSQVSQVYEYAMTLEGRPS